MKKIMLIIAIALIGVFSNQSFAQKKGSKIVCFKSSMDCENCEKTLSEYLKFEKGVKDLKIDHVSNTVMVEFKEGKNNAEEIAKAIEKKGYKANEITIEQYNKLMDKEKGESSKDLNEK